MKHLRALVEWLRLRLGRRGLVLAAFAVVFTLNGVKSIFYPAEDAGRFLLYTYLPVEARVVFWAVPAVIALVAAFRRDRRDGFGFAALMVPASLMVVSYSFSAFAFGLGLTDWPNGWADAARWALLTTILGVVSGWTEVTDRPIPRRRRIATIVVEDRQEDA